MTSMLDRSEETTRRSAERTRARIVAGARQLFSSKGYHGTGTAELIEHLGLGKGGLYHHFKKKQDVLLQIMLEPITEVLASSADVLSDSASDPQRALVQLGHDLGASMAKNLDAWTVLLREYSALDAEGRLHILELRQQYLDRWRTVLQQGMEQDLFEERDLAFVEGIFGYFIYAFVWNRGADPAHVTDNLMSVLTEGVRGSTSRRPSGSSGWHPDASAPASSR